MRKGKTGNWRGDRSQTTLWKINLDKNIEGGHSTQKPVKLMEIAINNHNGNICDPFLGTGSTLIAAHRLKRKCYGIEIEPKYVEVIIRRWAENCSVENGNVDFEHLNGDLTLEDIVSNKSVPRETSVK